MQTENTEALKYFTSFEGKKNEKQNIRRTEISQSFQWYNTVRQENVEGKRARRWQRYWWVDNMKGRINSAWPGTLWNQETMQV